MNRRRQSTVSAVALSPLRTTVSSVELPSLCAVLHKALVDHLFVFSEYIFILGVNVSLCINVSA